ncbi:MAG: hypothetical protein WC795_02975 [Candidatus Paceibacterota bacterium]|jgi:hypothetical protein
MKKSPSYKTLLIIAAICFGLNFLITIGIIGFVLKVAGVAALIWGIVEYFKYSKVIEVKIKK